MTLELKDLAHYLSHEIDAEINGEITRIMPYHLGMHLKQISRGQSFKLCCLPLSALTEQRKDGTIPIVGLAKVAGLNFVQIDGLEQINGWIQVFSNPKDSFYRFVYDTNTNGFRYFIDGNLYHVKNQLQLFEYLYQNHFWLGDQSYFEKGLILDKRTVKID